MTLQRYLKISAITFLSWVLILFMICFSSCKKIDVLQEQKINNPSIKYSSRSNPFPTQVNLGEDLVANFGDSVRIINCQATYATCGTSPDTESPNIGKEFYQISGPSQSTYYWNNSYPVVKDLITGTYTYVAHIWQKGFRSCDSTDPNEDRYDTINIRVKKNIQVTIKDSVSRRKHYIVYDFGDNIFTAKSLMYSINNGINFSSFVLLSNNRGYFLMKQFVKRQKTYLIKATCTEETYGDDFESNLITVTL